MKKLLKKGVAKSHAKTTKGGWRSYAEEDEGRLPYSAYKNYLI
jgi:hypothetical protein